MKFNTYSISELIDEIAMGPFGSNIKVECFVDKGIPVLNGSNLNGFFLREDSFRYVTEEKADSRSSGRHCNYSPWYAWTDCLHSRNLEV